ncbi:diaminopimelate decarboxylase [Desmospora profundinema]|uniref:Diaminopimelate decarboxylase n=1 Tax=Desmospora profundinema TaxID=1571184 RepID=A0ABU1IIG2_9BACL|nr:diaminopimelate decarboxylase [Desmospora profundinema]MDR6224566.1 diaminopimelate decarboxylase [Desmospora profundinema]
MHFHGTSRINEKGHLEIGGCDTTDLVRRWGTPLYVMDENLIRRRMRQFMEAFEATDLSFQVAYASKAFSTLAMCRLVEEEGLFLDVVSEGELYTALAADFPAERIYFHGNNKTPSEVARGLDAGIRLFVADNFTELHLLEALARERGLRVPILLRTTPGVEAHTHDYIQTGQEDSKFGFDLGSGQVQEAVRQCMESDILHLEGFHCHIGSQIFEVEGFRLAVAKMAELVRHCREQFGFHTEILNLGGGFGIRYSEGDEPLEPVRYVEAIAQAISQAFSEEERPEIWLEPGRSIVGEAGTTLYEVGTIKEIPGVRKYVAVDGGMNDNLRPALYQATYEAILANKADCEPEETVSIAGKLCETGDMLIWDAYLPAVESGDVLAVGCTGAYNYSMANNYNRMPRPAVVFVADGRSELVVMRETLDDLISQDVIPERLKRKTIPASS